MASEEKVERVISENQSLLTQYLAAVGCTKIAVLVMATELWDEDATLEMLEYCADHPKADQKELLKAADRIGAKWRKAESLLDTM